ncbi:MULTISPECIES: GNAT family N-acetyltransferase [unclassified Pseudoalteromonas]|uniref:GNAT family N-acetyltransferase n=1 Tax=unclassified Pseudoalteromonas TaxID=194690 RepID=UPI0005A8D95C|nr:MULTISPECIES: GNAT family N-acetyltransferase [unclassified Pseudoalteromonas]
MKYQIRLASKQDNKSIIKLMEAHAEFEGQPLKLTIKHDSLIDLNSLPITLFLVESGNEILGYMSVVKQFSTWDMDWYLYLDCLYLVDKIRGYGLGKDLMQQVKIFAKKQKISKVEWQTPKSNFPAISFYKKLGALSKEKQRFFWHVPS